jgi:hypothetical protein
MVWDRRSGIIPAMTSQDPLRDPAAALVEAAHAFHRAAEARGSDVNAPESLASLQEALQVLSAAWYRLAGTSPNGGGLSREKEARLVGALHDVAAALARCARACRDGGAWFGVSRPPAQRVSGSRGRETLFR